jgi:transposase
MIMTEHDPIPDDLPACQELLRSLLMRLHDLERQLEEFVATTEEMQRTYACLKEEHLVLKRMLFGPRRERLPEAPGQQRLFDDDAPPPPDESAPAAEDEESPPRKRKKGHGRRRIPDHLPRKDVPHDVSPAERVCDRGREKSRIGEDVTGQLEYEPGKMWVLRHIYPKYACSCCKDGVTSAERAASPIERGLAGPGLLAYVIVNKFADHLRLYRQQDRMARHGSFLSRSTLCGWLAQCAQLLRPLVELMAKRVVESGVINADETPVQVLDRTRDSTRKGQFWTYITPGKHGYTIYDYRDSRNRDGPTEFLIEDEIRLFGPDERKAVRQERSVPVLDRLMAYLREQKDGALPKSMYAQAIAYVLNRPDEMRRYTEDGRLEIDNNTSEQTLRLCAIGRKNWMFLGSDHGGETAAILFSILANAKRYQIEPFAYVRALLVALSSERVDLDSLLPDTWIAAHPDHVLQYRRDEAEAAANTRRRRRALRREKARGAQPEPLMLPAPIPTPST